MPSLQRPFGARSQPVDYICTDKEGAPMNCPAKSRRPMRRRFGYTRSLARFDERAVCFLKHLEEGETEWHEKS